MLSLYSHRLLYLIATFATAVLGGVLVWSLYPKNEVHGYWIWAGITEQDIPSNPKDFIYVWQGTISQKAGTVYYDRRGLFPYPAQHKNMVLVYRLEGELPSVDIVTGLFRDASEGWQRYGITIKGLQIDFDSPTAKLASYGDYLSMMRHSLPQNFSLSITGLGDWIIDGDRAALLRMTNAVDDIVFQLYQGREPIANAAYYAQKLRRANFPFRLGLLDLPNQNNLIDYVQDNEYYHGVIYFTQK